jgi:hypothetical protein
LGQTPVRLSTLTRTVARVGRTQFKHRDNYARLRDRLGPHPSSAAFFISRNGTRLLSQCVHFVFARLVKTVGLEPRPGCRRPHPHEYADVVVMPMSGRSPLLAGLIAV